MSNISVFDPAAKGGALAAPTYFADLFGADANIQSGTATPQLSIKGKNFRIILDGNETLLTRRNPDTGENEAVSSIKIVVLNQGDRGARAYYAKKYESGKGEAPVCFSLDGKVPDAKSREVQANTCASCEHAVKGSKITPSGHPTTACALQRRLAVIPANDLSFTPLLLRLAATSSWDKEDTGGNNQSGWFAWQQYLDFLLARGVRHTAQVVTMVKFDITEYPKLLFKADRFLTQEEAQKVAPRLNAAETTNLLTSIGDDVGSTAPDTPDATPPVTAPAPVPTPAPAAPRRAAAKPKPGPVVVADEVVDAPAPAPAPAKAVPVAATVEAVVEDILSAWDD